MGWLGKWTTGRKNQRSNSWWFNLTHTWDHGWTKSESQQLGWTKHLSHNQHLANLEGGKGQSQPQMGADLRLFNSDMVLK